MSDFMSPTTYVQKEGFDGGMGGFGGNSWCFLLLFLLGFNGNGFGNRNEGITNDFMFNNINNDLGRFEQTANTRFNGIDNGICQLGYNNLSASKDAQIQGMANTNTLLGSMDRGFDGLNSGITQLGYSNLLASKDAEIRGLMNTNTMMSSFDNKFESLSKQLADCCCADRLDNQAIRYEMAKNTCEIVTAGDKNTDRIINHLVQDKMQDLRDSKIALELQVSQQAQTAAIVDAVRPFPKPSYNTCSPYTQV